jgi:hypothetical protein
MPRACSRGPGEGSSLARHPDNLRMTDAAELVAIDVDVFWSFADPDFGA